MTFDSADRTKLDNTHYGVSNILLPATGRVDQRVYALTVKADELATAIQQVSSQVETLRRIVVDTHPNPYPTAAAADEAG